jgi:hypothetical protein
MARFTPEQVALPSPAGSAGVPPVVAGTSLPLMSIWTWGWIDRPPAAPLVAPDVAEPDPLPVAEPEAADEAGEEAADEAGVEDPELPEFDLDEQALKVMAATTTTARAPRIAARCTMTPPVVRTSGHVRKVGDRRLARELSAPERKYDTPTRSP